MIQSFDMKTMVAISPVNMDERMKLGIRAGDTVRVSQRIEEKGKTRLQGFEGLVLACKHGAEPGATFTVRRVSGGIGIEKIFPLYSPTIDKIEIIKRAKVRRAKLYYIRDKAAKEVRRQMRRSILVDIKTASEAEETAKREKEEQEARAAQEAEEKTDVVKTGETEEKTETATKEPKAEKEEEAGDETKKEKEPA